RHYTGRRAPSRRPRRTGDINMMQAGPTSPDAGRPGIGPGSALAMGAGSCDNKPRSGNSVPISETAREAHGMTDSRRHAGTAVRPASQSHQPFQYPLRRPFVEPDWRRVPGYRDVTQADWESALWQRKNTIKNLKELKEALGPLLPDALAAGIEKDQKERATM